MAKKPDSDEAQQVQQLLKEHKSRMKQQTIASELGWSETKTNQTISDLVDAGTVEKLRIGRENLVMLPERDDDTGNKSGSETNSTETDESTQTKPGGPHTENAQPNNESNKTKIYKKNNKSKNEDV